MWACREQRRKAIHLWRLASTHAVLPRLMVTFQAAGYWCRTRQLGRARFKTACLRHCLSARRQTMHISTAYHSELMAATPTDGSWAPRGAARLQTLTWLSQPGI